MRKIIGLGETIFDIIFQNNQPTASVPGGSTFNGIISLGRTGIPVSFISETGNDHVGEIILNFMRENGVSTDYMQVYPDGKSAISLAFLDEQRNAQYQFYKDYPACRMEVDLSPLPSDMPDNPYRIGIGHCVARRGRPVRWPTSRQGKPACSRCSRHFRA